MLIYRIEYNIKVSHRLHVCNCQNKNNSQEFVGTFRIYVSTKHYMPLSNDSLLIAVKSKAKHRFLGHNVAFIFDTTVP